MIFYYAIQGSTLPIAYDSYSNRISYMTNQRIQGEIVVLEDNLTIISLNEALLWSKYYPFTPLLSGKLINMYIYY